jgi:hypothetical protein
MIAEVHECGTGVCLTPQEGLLLGQDVARTSKLESVHFITKLLPP